MTKLFQLMSKEEGFGIPGSKPTRDNNPLDLEHAPHVTDFDGKIGIEDSLEDGIADGERQLELYASRGMTLASMIAIFAPPNENNTSNYLEFVCHGLDLPPNTLVSDALKIMV